jgi:hypothetical protein
MPSMKGNEGEGEPVPLRYGLLSGAVRAETVYFSENDEKDVLANQVRRKTT